MKTRPRLSLLSLLLIVALLASWFAVGLLSREVGPLRAEVGLLRDAVDDLQVLKTELDSLRSSHRKLMAEMGGLVVTDPMRLHAIRMPQVDDLSWSYRVYLPEGRNYYLACKINDLPIDGELPAVRSPIPENTIGSSGKNGMYSSLPPGEYVVRLALKRGGGEGWDVKMSTRHSGAPNANSTAGWRMLDPRGDKWPSVKGGLAATSGVTRQVDQRPSPGVFLLLNHRSGGDVDPPAPDSSAITSGAMLWIGIGPEETDE